MGSEMCIRDRRKNLMTIKQVNNLLNLLENRKDIKFEELALQKGMIDSADLNVMLQSKEVSVPSIRRLLVECGLLTQRQAMVLFEHFEKHGYTGVQRKAASNDMPKSNIGKTLTPSPVASQSSQRRLCLSRSFSNVAL